MMLRLLLALLSIAGVVAAMAVPGLGDLLLLAGPCAIAALLLLLRGPARAAPDLWPSPGQIPDSARQHRGGKPIVVDGSNIMYWRDNTPRLDTLREVLGQLAARGYAPGVVFDANAGYLLMGRYQHHGALGRLLGLPEERVMVVPKGEPADPVVLAAARDLGAPILSNDRFRDWAEAHPEVVVPGHVIRGQYRDGGLWLDLPAAS